MTDYYEFNSSNQKRFFLYIFTDREAKCILHIGEGECEGNIKSFLENRSLWEKVCASAQFPQQSKEEKKQGAKYDQIINSFPILLILIYGYHSAYSKTSPRFLNQKLSHKRVPDLLNFSTIGKYISIISICHWGIKPYMYIL